LNDPVIVNPTPAWNPAVDNQLALVVNGTIITQINVPGKAGLSDIGRAVNMLNEWTTPIIHAVTPGG